MTRSLAVPLALALLVSGCRLHLAQVTHNRPVRPASYDQIDLGAQSRNDVLAALGPPDEIAYTTSELVFDYTSAFHRGTDTRVFLPSDVLPGFNPLFIPLFILGLSGQHRRVYNYNNFPDLAHPEQQDLRILATRAMIVMLVFQIPFLINFIVSIKKGKKAGQNPWFANTLEWTADSPPPHGNWDTLPDVYRGPYEYSHPDREDDYWPQNTPA